MVDKRIRIILDSRQAKAEADKLNKSVKDVGESADRTQFSFNKLAAAIATVLATSKIIEYSDAWNRVENQLIRTNKTQLDLLQTSSDLLKIANETRFGIEETASLYTSLTVSTDKLGYSQQQLYGVTKTINNLFLESGKSVSQVSGALYQLNQGLESGVLRGEELNSVLEGAPGIIRAVEKELKIGRTELRAMAEQGELTSKILVESLLKYEQAAQNAADRTEITWEQAKVVTKNNLTFIVGQLDNAIGATAAFSEALVSLTNVMGEPRAIQTIITAFEALSVVIGAKLVASLINATAAQVQQTASSIAAIKAEQSLAAAMVRRADAEKAVTFAILANAKAELQSITAKVASIRQIQLQGKYYGDLNAVLERQAIAQAKVAAATVAAAEAATVATAATARLALANGEAAAKTTLLGVAGRGLQGVMGLLGGPVGLITLAAGALLYYASSASEAADANELLSRSIDGLSVKQAKATSLELVKAIDQEREKVDELSKSLERVKRQEKLAIQDNVNPAAMKEFTDEIIRLEAEMETAQKTSLDLNKRLSELGEVGRDPVGPPIPAKKKESKAEKAEKKATAEFEVDIEGIRQNTKDLERELQLRNDLAEIYDVKAVNSAETVYAKQRVILAQAEAAKLAELQASFEKENDLRSSQFDAEIQKVAENEERVLALSNEYKAQSSLAEQIYQAEITRIKVEGSQNRLDIDIEEQNALRQIESFKDVTTQLENELAARNALRQFYTSQELDSEYNKYQVLREQQEIEEGEAKVKEEEKYTAETQNRALAFEELLASMEYENETKAILSEEFEIQEQIRKQIHEETLSQIEQDGASKRTAIAKMERDARLQMAQTAGNDLMALAQGHSKKAFELGKMVARSSAAVSGGLAAVDAWKAGMATGGPWAPVIAAGYTAASLLKTGNLIRQINAQQFNSGGNISSGGGSVSIPTPGNSGAGESPSRLPEEKSKPSMSVLVVQGIDDDTLVQGRLFKKIQGQIEQSWKDGDGIGRVIFESK